MSTPNENGSVIPVKVVLLGGAAIGAKTSLLYRYIGIQTEESGAADFKKEVVVNDMHYCLELWDTLGSDRFRSLSLMILRGSKIALVGFDVTHKATMDICDSWVEELRSSDTYRKVVIVAVGNKIDLVAQRQIGTEEARSHFEAMNIPYFETSALTGEGVNEVFENALKLWIETNNDNEPEDDKSTVLREEHEERKGHCIIC